MEIETAPYRITRIEMARLASTEWLRNFWWIAVPVPLFGVIALIVGQGILQVIGMFAVLWPFSIPARAVIATSKSSELFAGGVRMRLTGDRIEFLGEAAGKNGKPYRMKIPLMSVRDVVRRGDFVLVRTKGMHFSPIRISAFQSPEDAASLNNLEYRPGAPS